MLDSFTCFAILLEAGFVFILHHITSMILVDMISFNHMYAIFNFFSLFEVGLVLVFSTDMVDSELGLISMKRV